MSGLPNSYLAPEEYLSLERKAEYKSEYSHGEMFAMSGASREHNPISLNIGSELRAQLRGRPCETYASDMRVRIAPPRRYLYPDVVVVCGDAEFEDESVDTLVNPTVIMEVLSGSTESYDRGTKFGWYRRIESLGEYVLISQDTPHVERFVKHEEGWVLIDAEGMEATLRLESLGCELALAEIYDRVTFPSSERENPEPLTPAAR
jgi:Uma2 family endonuclease